MSRFLFGLILMTSFVAIAVAGPKRHRERISAGAAQIDTVVEGSGPLIVLLPSRGRDSEDYDPVAADLARRGYRVLRPQPRGMLGSTGPLSGLTLHDFADDVAAVIAAQHAGPAVIVGHAYGNWVARMTAVDHPSLVRGVVLAAAAAKDYPPGLSLAVSKVADPDVSPTERRRYLEQAFFAPGHDPSSWLGGWHTEAGRSQNEAARATTQSAWWSAGNVPLLDLQAGEDPFKPVASRNELKDEFGARVTIVVVPGTSHALLPEAPKAVADAIAAWVSRLP